MTIRLRDLANIAGAKIEGDPELIITGAAKIEEASQGEITFLANPKYERYIYDCQASAALVSIDFVPQRTLSMALLRVEDVYATLGLLLGHFGEANESDLEKGGEVSDRAFISTTATIGEGCSVGVFASIGHHASVGANTRIGDHVTIGDHVEIGEHCVIHAGVRILRKCKVGSRTVIHANTVIGSDGFGFAPDQEGVYEKIPQIGNVVVGDDVELGSNVTIDRATMGSTVIKKGVKIDNLVQIAHNVIVGEHTVIAAQAGVAGSTEIGSHCLIGGQVGIAGHIKIADYTQVQAQSGVQKSTKINDRLFGSPAIPYTNYQRSFLHFKNLDDLVSRLRAIENRLKE